MSFSVHACVQNFNIKAMYSAVLRNYSMFTHFVNCNEYFLCAQL